MRGECIKFISLSFSLVSFQKLYFELFIARFMRFDSCKSLLAIPTVYVPTSLILLWLL